MGLGDAGKHTMHRKPSPDEGTEHLLESGTEKTERATELLQQETLDQETGSKGPVGPGNTRPGNTGISGQNNTENYRTM